ncbi:hypothetical protein CSV71_14900 [Sporosarcina sp. P21c]|uniref:hypothetical protein n=1 Tax=Sporosarcina sp. P21c TaxID=2048255 RepID=UPI000C1685AA|nr:hypothetical protein [Sporosarcina sp. P21c]PIC88412.1 hypothetical protein CSV71_14900 [Sporosarcina sp. P21c]
MTTETNAERLERIEFSGEGLEDEDFEWLIQQAERVQELEKQLNETKALPMLMELEKRKSENARLRKALEFYADDYKWFEENKGSPFAPDYRMEIQSDGGDVARQALNGESP